MNIFDNLKPDSEEEEEEEDNNPFSGTNHMFASGVAAIPSLDHDSDNTSKPIYEYSDNVDTYKYDSNLIDTIEEEEPDSNNSRPTSSSSQSSLLLSKSNSDSNINTNSQADSDSSHCKFEPYENLSMSIALQQHQNQLDLIQDSKNWEIQVLDSGDFSDQWGKHAVGYLIKFEDKEVTRRYSEFSSLHQILMKFFPTIIIPPIPSKHSIIKYFLNPINAQYDGTIIEKRKRRFVSFLNNCNNIPEIKNHQIFQKFLNPEYTWKDVMNSPPVTILPLNNLLAPPLYPTKPSPLHLLLPSPTLNNLNQHALLNPSSLKDDHEIFNTNLEFTKLETKLSNYLIFLQPMLNKIKHNKFHLLSLSSQLTELGAFYNALSLENNPFSKLSTGIEKIGHAFDVNYISLEILTENLQNLVEEQMDEIVKALLDSKRVIIFKTMKLSQYQIIKNTLEKRQSRLTELKDFEDKLIRLDEALNRDAVNSPTIAKIINNMKKDNDSNGNDTISSNDAINNTDQSKQKQQHLHLQYQLQYQLQKKKKKLNKYTSKFGSLEPEFLTKSEREEEIKKINKEIEKLNECFKLIRKDINEVNNSTMVSLVRLVDFINNKLNFMLKNMTKIIINYITECLKVWKEAKLIIKDI